jgi:hypothetical protein
MGQCPDIVFAAFGNGVQQTTHFDRCSLTFNLRQAREIECINPRKGTFSHHSNPESVAEF